MVTAVARTTCSVCRSVVSYYETRDDGRGGLCCADSARCTAHRHLVLCFNQGDAQAQADLVAQGWCTTPALVLRFQREEGYACNAVDLWRLAQCLIEPAKATDTDTPWSRLRAAEDAPWLGVCAYLWSPLGQRCARLWWEARSTHLASPYEAAVAALVSSTAQAQQWVVRWAGEWRVMDTDDVVTHVRAGHTVTAVRVP